LLAEQELRAHATGPLTAERAYELVKQITGDEDEADKASAAIMAEEVRRETNAASK